MKFPNSLILKYENSNKSTRQYWLIKFIFDYKFSRELVSKFNWFNNELSTNKFYKNRKKFTLTHSQFKDHKILNEREKKLLIKIFESKKILKKRDWHVSNKYSNQYEELIYNDEKINIKKFLRMLYLLKKKNFSKKSKSNISTTSFNIIYFKKEKIYTKLKYSRVPQYDAVSGGSAALLAGFLGFLITEKFGLELMDSGDFWFLFLYIAFAGFTFPPLLKMIIDDKLDFFVLSLSWGLFFYKSFFYIIYKNLSHFFNKLFKIFK